MTRLYVLWAFISWCFMKMFGGCFNLAEKFRYELKKGAPDSIFAIAGFLILSVVTFMAVGSMAIWLSPSKEFAGEIMGAYFTLDILTFIYNVVKAAYECFEDERQDIIERLRT